MPTKSALKRVISASRRTDLVAHYPEQLAARLRQLGPESIHTVVIWTKDATNLLRHQGLRDALAQAGQVFVHWTITGLGGSFLEPSVPPPAAQLALLDELVAFLGDHRRLHWRYDPLISARRGEERAGNLDPSLFQSLAEPLAAAGVPVVHTSFVTLYPKVVRRLAAAGVKVEEMPPEERPALLEGLSAAAQSLGMALTTCCEPAHGRRRCIDGDLLTALHPAHEPCRTDRAKGQRDLCGCTASLDVGSYLPCPNRCLYCYAHPQR
jgi:DNA repair photolyase